MSCSLEKNPRKKSTPFCPLEDLVALSGSIAHIQNSGVEKGERKGTSLTKPTWTSIGDSFTTKTGRVYTRIQLKNKFDALRKEWQLWDRLLCETEVPGYKKFRERGLQFRAELTQLFGSVAATGPQSWVPSSMTLPSEGVLEDDMEEGSGDSDEILGAPTGISGEFNSVTFNDNSGGSRGNTRMRQETIREGRSTGLSSSLGVRKKVESMKKKPTTTMKIADALTRIAQANENDSQREHEEISKARTRKLEEEARAYEMSIAGVMEHLNEVDEIVDDPDLFGRCTTLLIDKPIAREMYVALKNKKEKLLIFLKHATKD
ncbi:uncharacterized protein LOC114745235 [Neltuma alba]|uniref:uncharacterized protein LOC114745235 n=1 Tax=Neltuma alba TaxID=207710 RepID=UPI0010A4D64E|nr:uncharacterized protein LOC114745235 [Prosopis alba]